MTIASAILEHFPDLNDAQREVVAHVDGPLLVVAGPGSGKTYSIVLRALNLLLLERAAAKEIVLCTFTENAAFEMRDRLSAAARTVGYQGDLSELRVTTIHGLCNRILTQHRHRTELGNSYETLDELTQLLFIFDHFDEIIGLEENNLYLSKWKTRWTAIEGARGYFDKITEELVDSARLSASPDTFTLSRLRDRPLRQQPHRLRSPTEHRAQTSHTSRTQRRAAWSVGRTRAT
jgi:DNA helicase-2/ATP-dependent DNA helicase PcrA